MESNQINPDPKVNEKPERDHKKQSFWQILLPLGLVIILFILASVWVSLSSSSNQELGLHWANVSTIFLMIPILLVSLIFLVILAGLVYGFSRLLSIIPPYFGQVIQLFNRVSEVILIATDKMVSPIFLVQSQSAKVKTIKSILSSSLKSKPDNK